MKNAALTTAKREKNDEFYTQYADIEKEMNAYLDYDPDVFRGKTILLPCDDPEWSNFTKYFAQNFERLGLKKLISTSYAPQSKPDLFTHEPSAMERSSEHFDTTKTHTRGKYFVITDDHNRDGRIDFNDLTWDYLEGDGDFRSDEVTRLRDEADVVVTNPPFSLFRAYIEWVMEANKGLLAIASRNCITYKEIFPLIQKNRLWLGHNNNDMSFMVPSYYEPRETRFWIDDSGQKWRSMGSCIWLTNLQHGRRHQPLPLMSMDENLKFHKRLIKQLDGETSYQRYDNYDAIEVPFVDAIPSDYDGLMGVPITFLDKYCPDQFEILGCSYSYGDPYGYHHPGKSYSATIDEKPVYKRLFIKSLSNRGVV